MMLAAQHSLDMPVREETAQNISSLFSPANKNIVSLQFSRGLESRILNLTLKPVEACGLPAKLDRKLSWEPLIPKIT